MSDKREWRGTKRQMAAQLREAARILEECGWLQGEFGSADRGYCSIGALGTSAMRLNCGCGMGPTRAAFRNYLYALGHKEGVIVFNDKTASCCKEVTQAMRGCARALEHGWSPG